MAKHVQRAKEQVAQEAARSRRGASALGRILAEGEKKEDRKVAAKALGKRGAEVLRRRGL